MRLLTIGVLIILTFFVFSLSSSAQGLLDALSGLLSPGDCSVKAFSETCTQCVFTPEGKVDEICKEAKLNAGKGCLFSTYPDATVKYNKKECPAIDACISGLESCINKRCPGSDKQDCSSDYCKTCYSDGDRCVARASLDCMASAKCPNSKCESDKGENQETCCADCGCPQGKECKNNACNAPGTEPKPDVVVSTTMLSEINGESEGPPQGLGIFMALLSGLLEEIEHMCGGGQVVPLLMTSISMIIGIPTVVLIKKNKCV